MKTKLYFSLLLAMTLSSCATYSYRESTARYLEPKRAGFITPVTADMEVSQNKITNQVEVYAKLTKNDIAGILRAEAQGKESALVLSWKKYALAETISKYQADDIVTPTFTIEPSNEKESTLIITVSGHTAVYKNYRAATKEDVDLITPFLEQKKDINASGVLQQVQLHSLHF